MKALHLEEKLRDEYDHVAEVYRASDEIDAQRPDHQRIARKLGLLSGDFGHSINVLELGCGTGRFFYSLKNVDRLVGIDVSERMLKAAQKPLNEHLVTAKEIQLRKDNLYTAAFPEESFDLIYCVGVFGNGCVLTAEFCDAVYSWLKPGAKFFFDAIDTSDIPPIARLRKRVKSTLYEMLPSGLQAMWDRRIGWMPFFLTNEKHLIGLLAKTKFNQFEVVPERAQLTLGPGIKLECTCGKAGEREASNALVESSRRILECSKP